MTEQAPDTRAKFRSRMTKEQDRVTESESLRALPPPPLAVAWSGIVQASGCFPIVLGGIVVFCFAFAKGFQDVSTDLLRSLIFVIPSFIAGASFGILLSIPAFFLTQFLRWSLSGIVSERGASGIYGGMTGFVCFSWSGVFFTLPFSRDWVGWVQFILVLQLAVVMGYAGAIWAGYRKRNAGFPFYEPIFSQEKQITIGVLMKLTLIAAALSAISKAAGSDGWCIGIASAVYLLLQTLLLFGDHWLTRWMKHG